MAHFSLQAKEMVYHHTYCTSYYHHDEQIVTVTPSPISQRIGLDYSGEVHQLVKNFNPKKAYLRQRLVWRTRGKYNTLKMPQVGVL